jgi:hypothetical protein
MKETLQSIITFNAFIPRTKEEQCQDGGIGREATGSWIRLMRFRWNLAFGAPRLMPTSRPFDWIRLDAPRSS